MPASSAPTSRTVRARRCSMSRRTSATASATRRHSVAGSPTSVSSVVDGGRPSAGAPVRSRCRARRPTGPGRRRSIRPGPGRGVVGVGLVEPPRGEGEQVLDRLLRLRSGGADLDLVAVQRAERGDPAQAAGRHRAGAGRQVAQRDGGVEATRPRSPAGRPGGRAGRAGWSPRSAPTTSVAAGGSAARRARRRRRPARWAALPISAARASAATSARLGAARGGDRGDDRAPRRAAPSESTTRSRAVGSSSRSSASSALSTALPRSIRTTTPSGPSTFSIASLIRTASVPNVVLVEPGRHLDPHRAAVQHLAGQADRGPGQRAAVGDDDDARRPVPMSWRLLLPVRCRSRAQATVSAAA